MVGSHAGFLAMSADSGPVKKKCLGITVDAQGIPKPTPSLAYQSESVPSCDILVSCPTLSKPGGRLYLWLCLTRRTSKGLPSSTGNSAPCHVAAGVGGEFGGQGMRVYVWLSLPSVHLEPSQQHCQSAVLQCKIKSFLSSVFLGHEPGCWNGFHILLRERSPDHCAHFSFYPVCLASPRGRDRDQGTELLP